MPDKLFLSGTKRWNSRSEYFWKLQLYAKVEEIFNKIIIQFINII